MNHHLPGDWLAAWSAGTLDEARELLVATHLTLCPACRAEVAHADRLAGRQLSDAAEVALEPGGLDRLLARLDEPPPEVVRPDSPWPAPVASFVEGETWRWLAPFTWGIDLPHTTDGELPLRLVWMRPGARLRHANTGVERAVVLQGGWSDEHGHFVRGDVAISDHLGLHDQRIDPGEPCVALVLNDRRAELPGLLRPLGGFTRI